MQCWGAGWLVVVMLASRAQADPDPVQLFREGRALMDRGKLDEACDRFAESAKVAPKVGTLLNLGDCLEQIGRLASAKAAFDEAARQAAATSDARRVEAARRAQLIADDVPYLRLQVERSPAGLTVRRNGVPVDVATLDAAVPLDPGEYAIEATAPGFRGWSRQLALRRRDHVTIDVTLVPEAPPSIPGPAPEAPGMHPYGVGVAVGSNTRERLVGGGYGLANLALPRGFARGVFSIMYSRYKDVVVDGGPEVTVQTFYLSVGADYVYMPVSVLAMSAGVGFGAEIDREQTTGNDIGAALHLRAAAIGRLARGHVEAGLQFHLAFAASEVTLYGLVGATWLP